MIRRAVWRVASTELLTRFVLAVSAVALGSLGIYLSFPAASLLATIFIFLLVYRLRYKRF